jgi:hypothetical protein
MKNATVRVLFLSSSKVTSRGCGFFIKNKDLPRWFRDDSDVETSVGTVPMPVVQMLALSNECLQLDLDIAKVYLKMDPSQCILLLLWDGAIKHHYIVS